MTVTPEQIESASFSMVKRGGYRTEEVDQFLRAVAGELRALHARVRAAEGANEDLNAASQEMATLMRDVHAQLGEKRRVAENEVQEMLQAAERDAAAIIASAADKADEIRMLSDRVLTDAENHAELLRSDGEQRVRERAQETLRAARSELQDLVRRKHEVLHALAALRSDLADMESTIEAAAVSPDAIDDSIVNQTLIDLREQQQAATAAAQAPSGEQVAGAGATPAAAPPPPPPAPAMPPSPAHPTSAHPSADRSTPGSSTFFSPPDAEA